MINEMHLVLPHFRFISSYAAKKMKNMAIDLFGFNEVQ